MYKSKIRPFTFARRTLLCFILSVLVLTLLPFSSGRTVAEDGPENRNQNLKATPQTQSAPSADATTELAAEPKKELFSGKVILLTDALKKRGIKSAEEMKGQVVLETSSGELCPLIADWRGRAFFQDERLRNRQVDLVVHRRQGLPYLQVLSIFTFNEAGERQYTDYWCDICSIPMYEIKDCECCQGPIRLRFQKQDLPSYLPQKSKTQSVPPSGKP